MAKSPAAGLVVYKFEGPGLCLNAHAYFLGYSRRAAIGQARKWASLNKIDPDKFELVSEEVVQATPHFVDGWNGDY
jgi:hypothetical protein